jgi:hypothetical protein
MAWNSARIASRSRSESAVEPHGLPQQPATGNTLSC